MVVVVVLLDSLAQLPGKYIHAPIYRMQIIIMEAYRTEVDKVMYRKSGKRSPGLKMMMTATVVMT